jgi:hypothetical protein
MTLGQLLEKVGNAAVEIVFVTKTCQHVIPMSKKTGTALDDFIHREVKSWKLRNGVLEVKGK